MKSTQILFKFQSNSFFSKAGSKGHPCQSDNDCMTQHVCDIDKSCQPSSDVIQSTNIDYADKNDKDYTDNDSADDDSSDSENTNTKYVDKAEKIIFGKNALSPLSFSVKQNPVDHYDEEDEKLKK